MRVDVLLASGARRRATPAEDGLTLTLAGSTNTAPLGPDAKLLRGATVVTRDSSTAELLTRGGFTVAGSGGASRVLSVRLPSALYERLHAVAEREGVPVGKLIADAIEARVRR